MTRSSWALTAADPGNPDRTWYILESATGTWAGEGSSQTSPTSCPWAGAGDFSDNAWSADLQLVPADREHLMDFVGQEVGQMPGHCTNKNGAGDIETMLWIDAHEDTGNAEALPFDPSNLQIHGSETAETAFGNQTQTWIITPVGDPAP